MFVKKSNLRFPALEYSAFLLTPFICLLLTGCPQDKPPTLPDTAKAPFQAATSLPPLGAMKSVAPGVLFGEVTLPRGEQSSKLWVYLPEKKPSGNLPCVLIAPAGSPMFVGMGLGDGDRPEHLPYAKAGFAVIAYELDGAMPQHEGEPTDAEGVRAAAEFQRADGGLKNAQDALRYALARVPNIDPNRIYVAGHSSAATVALYVASHEPRIAACAAYAPGLNVREHIGDEMVSYLSQELPLYDSFIEGVSATQSCCNMKCPVFLFQADDDKTVSPTQAMQYAEQLKRGKVDVTFETVMTGGHYDSMINEGVPRAIEWFKKLAEKGSTASPGKEGAN